MIPLLFSSNAVLPDRYNSIRTLPEHFVLSETMSAVVSEELNGKYELQLTYPGDGQFANSIQVGSVIAATPNQWRSEDDGDNGMWKLDYFRVYKITIDQRNVFTINCEQISYILNDQKVGAYSTTSIANAVTRLNSTQTMIPKITCTSNQATQAGTAAADANTTILAYAHKIAEAFGMFIECIHYEMRFLTTRARHETPWRIQYGANMVGYKYEIARDKGITTATVTVTPISEQTEQPITIGDPCIVSIPQHNIFQQSQITAYEWDVLQARYKKITVGAIKQNLADVLLTIR